MKRKWTLYVINHSHTDVGYTERQERIERYHYDFLKQAMAIEDSNYKWTVETFWAIDIFNKFATDKEKSELKAAIKDSSIGLSATYLNLSDTLDPYIYSHFAQKAIDYAKSCGIELKSGMTADVNGFSTDYAQGLTDLGVNNLLSCLHPHHGMYPVYKKPLPVWWELPNGSKILTWHGEHYQIGNDLGLSPGAQMSYSIKDHLQDMDGTLNDVEENIAFERITRYLENLESDDFPVDIIPLPVSGLVTDNSSPSALIMTRIRELNERFNGQIDIKISTLDEFFVALRDQELENIKTVKGEWPDWWTDGVGSTPLETQLFRNSQRKLEIVRNLDPDNQFVDNKILNSAFYNQMLYSEHTWGLSESIRQPGLFECHELLSRKKAYAANGARDAGLLLDNLLEKKYQDTMLKPGRELKYKIINPNPFPVKEVANLTLKYWEMSQLKNGYDLVDLDGKIYPTSDVNGALHFCEGIITMLDLKAFEVKEVVIVSKEYKSKTAHIVTTSGIDLVDDDLAEHPEYHGTEGFYLESDSLTTDNLQVKWTRDRGIYSMVDIDSGNELVDTESEYGAFQLIYDTTPENGNQETRRMMGRNRRGVNFTRSIGKITSVTRSRKNDLLESYKFDMDIDGCTNSSVNLIFYKNSCRVDVLADFTKLTTLDPENLYIALPFKSSNSGELWLQMGRSDFRPWTDQIEGSLTDFYAIKDGFSHNSEDFGIAISSPDTHLLQVGSIEYEQRLLQGNPKLKSKKQNTLSWVMNNYWETNFNGNLGGFYNIHYSLAWGKGLSSVEESKKFCISANKGLLVTRRD